MARTCVISNSQSPVWNECFKIPLAHPVSEVEFYIKDNDVFDADLIGVTTISARRILFGETISEWLLILNSLGKPLKPDASLLLEMRFTKCEDNPIYRCGITTDPDHFVARNSYFPVRKGGSITLYQDVHEPESLSSESLMLAREFFYCVSKRQNMRHCSVNLICWNKPDLGWFKLNSDGASQGNPGRAGGGGLIHDHDGKWVKGFMRNIG